MKIPAFLDSPLKAILPKLLIVTSVFLIALFLTAGHSNAQENANEADYYDSYSSNYNSNLNPDVSLNTHNGVQVLFIEFLATIQCQLSGTDPLGHGNKCLGVDRETGKIGFVENGGGAIATMGRLIDHTFVLPASGVGYVAYMRSNFGLTKGAYAQAVGTNSCLGSSNGVGFCSIEPLLPIWKVMRNIVYLLFILVFIVIGIGIMLRIHIDPRTVMTIQNQIPKIIVGILAITFSFAIAGFLIDVMYVAIYLFASAIGQATGFDANTSIKITQATDPFTAINAAWNNVDPGAEVGIYDIASRTATSFSDIVEASLQQVSENLGLLNNLIGGILDILGTIIIFIAILILLIRLFITLLIAFLNIILDIIFAPWWILAGLFPGGPLGLGAWIRDLIANLAVFPVTIGFMLLGAYLMGVFFNNSNGIGRLNFPMLGTAGNSQAIAALIGFGFILMLPSLLSAVKAGLKTPNLSFGPILQPVGAAGRGMAGLPKRGFEMRERYSYNRQGGVGRWQSLVANPLLRPQPRTPFEPGHGGTGGGSSEH